MNLQNALAGGIPVGQVAVINSGGNMKSKLTKLNDMIAFASTGHIDQYDKGGLPYILHPLHVANAIGYNDEDRACIAVGHDLIEDTFVTYEMLLQHFGLRIAEGIRCLTKVEGESYEDYKKKVLSNPDSIIVKMQDLLHNSDLKRLKGVTAKDKERQVKYMQFYWECVEASLK